MVIWSKQKSGPSKPEALYLAGFTFAAIDTVEHA